MNLIKKAKKSILSLSYYQVYVIVASIALTVFFVECIVFYGQTVSILTINMFTRFDDYYMHLGYASAPAGTNIYELSNNACFPPLAYLLYSFLAHISGFVADDYSQVNRFQLYAHNMPVFIIYNMICFGLLIFAVSLYFKKHSFLNIMYFPCLLLFSYPIAFTAFQRGNSIFLVVSLVAIALAWKDDESKFKREMAMILIAVCAGLKIYPAVLGLLYLREKRWKETIRLIIYGIVLFIVPFAFFGGFEAIKTFFGTIIWLYGEVHITSVNGVVMEAVKNIFGRNAALFASIIQQLFLILSLTAFFLLKEKWSQILILCGLMALYISSSWMYTCIYFIPPMLMFFKEQNQQPLRINKKNWPDLIAFILFSFCFTIPYHFGYETFYPIVVVILSVYIIVVIARALMQKLYKVLKV